MIETEFVLGGLDVFLNPPEINLPRSRSLRFSNHTV